ncbi:MAG TPA: hypothetical protein VKZ49_06650 [Polyangiaceae bacterium]|nr:hypothetical protein [Polyangiaceae bacterium]
MRASNDTSFTTGCGELRIRLSMLVCTLAVLLGSPMASAAPAPWCDPQALTIEAPLQLVRAQPGEVRAAPPCGDAEELQFDTQRQRAPDDRVAPSAELIERALPSAFGWPPRTRGPRLGLSPEQAPPAQGVERWVYRPPRA